jgi:hypothetical protein
LFQHYVAQPNSPPNKRATEHCTTTDNLICVFTCSVGIRGLKWAKYVERKENHITAYKILIGKSHGKTVPGKWISEANKEDVWRSEAAGNRGRRS